jgi:hypothetical protein
VKFCYLFEICEVGSKYYAQVAYSSGYKIAGVLNMDMIGYDSNNDRKFEIHTNNMTTSLALKNELLSILNNYSLSLVPTVVNPGVTASDHSSFWNKNYGAVVVSELFFHGDPNPYYHTDGDRISRFNLTYFKEIAKLHIGTLASLAEINPSCEQDVKELSVSPNNQDVGSSAGNTTFSITSNTSWAITDNAGWLTVNPASGSGNGTITATFTANTLTTPRVATITISGTGASSQQVTVTQSEMKTLSVTPSNQNVGQAAGNTTFSISSNTSWTIADDAGWLTVNPASGSGNGTITASFTTNTLTTPRVGTITISGTGVSSQQVTVTQSEMKLLSVTPSNQNVEPAAGNTTFSISSNTTWTIADDAGWLTINPASGSGNGTITATFTANTLTSPRVATITISGTGASSQQVTVTQSEMKSLSVTPSNRDVGPEAGSTTFSISSNTTWTIADDAGWLLVNPLSGSGNATITATCEANTLTTPRVGTITISGTGVSSQQVTVTQSEIISLIVTPSDQNVGPEAGSTTFSISSNTSWTIADDAGWLTINPASGNGNATITATYATNTLTTPRVGTITISGAGVSSQQVTVTQNEIKSLSVTPSNRDVGPEAGSTTFSIISNTSWTIDDDAGWLTINPASGSGNGTITATYTNNTLAAQRIGTVTISGAGVSSQQVTVTQSEINLLSVTPSARNVGPEAGSTTFSISSNTTWTIADDAGWLSVNPSSGNGNAIITATCTANTLTTARVGTITISGTGVSPQTVTVTQSEMNLLSVTPSNRDVGPEAGSTTFIISSNTGWTIDDDANWLTVNPASGSGNATITATYATNTLTSPRIGTISISGTGVTSQQVTVTQGEIKSLSVTPSNQNEGPSAGSTTFSIISNTSWTIADDAAWLTVNPASGSGNATITATFTANTLTTPRVGTITISGTGVSPQSVTVTQTELNSLSVTPSDQVVGPSAGSTTFSISSNTSWTITDNAAWLIVNPVSGSDNLTITATYSANTLTTPRVGIITISGTGVSSQTVTVTQSEIYSISVTPSYQNVGPAAGSTTFSISSNTSWTIADDAGWLTVNPASGSGNGTMTATFAANTLATPRVGTITISGTGVTPQTVTITQSEIKSLSVTPSNRDVGPASGSTTFTINSNTTWTITDDESWLTINPASGSGNVTITATFTANALTTPRVGTITISGTGVSSKQVTVTQNGIKSLSVTPSNQNVGPAAGSTSFSINSNTSWTIADDAGWLTVNPASGSGNATITATCTANTMTTPRVGTITISGTGVSSQQVTVTQGEIKSLSVTPPNQDVGPAAGTTTFSIISNTSWTIADDAGWLTINPASGSGNATITATCAANTLTSPRIGTITISGVGVSSQQVTVTQAESKSLSVTPSNRNIGAEAGSTTFSISSNTSWTIADDSGWLTVNPASGSGNATITATYAENTLTSPRIGTITISGAGVSSQQVTVTQTEMNSMSVTPSNRDVGSEAGNTTFGISSNTSWSIAIDAEWLTVNPAGGSGSTTVTATFAANTLATTRIGTITISGTGVSSQQVTVTQSGINSYLIITPSNQDAGSEAGNTTFNINSNTGWTITDDAEWITVNPESGSRNETITVTYTANKLGETRIGTITLSATAVSSQQVTVTQSGTNTGWDLKQNYPNPFTHVTTIEFFVPEPCHVELTIFNINGITLDILLNENLDAGSYSIDWIPPLSLKSGIYFYELRTDEPQIIKKMLYNKR